MSEFIWKGYNTEELQDFLNHQDIKIGEKSVALVTIAGKQIEIPLGSRIIHNQDDSFTIESTKGLLRHLDINCDDDLLSSTPDVELIGDNNLWQKQVKKLPKFNHL